MLFVNHHAAFDWFRKSFRNIDHVNFMNKGRHMVLYLKDGRILYCLFKRTFIHSFNYLAKDLLKKYPLLSGHGESINVEFAYWAFKHNAKLIYIYEDGKVYETYPATVMKVSVVREQTKENRYVEGNVSIVRNEKEYIFPCKLLEPLTP